MCAVELEPYVQQFDELQSAIQETESHLIAKEEYAIQLSDHLDACEPPSSNEPQMCHQLTDITSCITEAHCAFLVATEMTTCVDWTYMVAMSSMGYTHTCQGFKAFAGGMFMMPGMPLPTVYCAGDVITDPTLETNRATDM
ncbi:unnamed protein product [Vitrella brassicaformis CCMP3155]|uniref:Uncharacterized protein n=1 Tax=Vitrella brassicaformis (strain CCMP3155) TaxID=1169540 RepID=A0A0G4F7Y3_VITBC|nr:unnamed protein product [Vitrella brassicaformis CCMP3155]|eukprot:CEM08818.1 unnamed protein product [Vitrella brassicaformis CCMP3155]